MNKPYFISYMWMALKFPVVSFLKLDLFYKEFYYYSQMCPD